MTQADRISRGEGIGPDDTLCGLFQQSARTGGDTVALRGGGTELTWREYADRVEALAVRWSGVGVVAGSKVALMLSNSPEFHLLDTSLLHARATPFSVSATDPVERLVGLLDVAGATALVTDRGGLAVASAVAEACSSRPVLVVVDGDATPGVITLAELEAAAAQDQDFDSLWREVSAEDDATLIFTSGTTGEPKAVRLSHRVVVQSLRNTGRIAPVEVGGHILSYLPLTHIAERFMSHYFAMGFALTITSVADPDTLYDEIVRTRPSRFFGVPRVYEKLVARVQDQVAADDRLRAAVEVGLACVRAEQAGEVLDEHQVRAFASAVETLAPVRASLGLDRTEYRGVATAPASPTVLETMSSIGLPVGNIWGMSEAIMCTMNPPERLKLATVGVFLDDVEGRVADDGELLVRGVNLFSGYLGDEERTAESFDAQGWFHTGDLGRLDEDGYLTLVGRKKDILITATGKNIAPAAIEAALKEASPLIDHVVVVADGRRYVTVLIALDAARLETVAAGAGLVGDFETLAGSPEVEALLTSAVEAANGRLQKAETVRAWTVSDHPWQPGGDEVTGTMKLRRAEITRIYADQIEGLYR